VFIPPSSATLFLYQWSSLARGNLAVMCLHRQRLHEEQAREGAREANPKRMDLAEEMVGLHEHAHHVNTYVQRYTGIDPISFKRSQRRAGEGKSLLSCSVLARSTEHTADCLVGHAVIGGNLAKGFVVLMDTVHHARPFLRGNTLLRLLWAWTLLCGEERGDTAKYSL
jgi:hypothetical protein